MFSTGRALILGLALLATGSAMATETIPLEEIEAGMKGYGLTVFSGSRVDTFAVEVIGVQHRSKIGGGAIMIEASGHGLDLSSIAQGMSGSPIYLDGRLAGALAFGWPGSLRPIAGVTPVGEMLAIPSQPTTPTRERMGYSPDTGQDLLGLQNIPGHLALELTGQSRPRAEAPGSEEAWPHPDALVLDLLGERLAQAGWDRPRDESWFTTPLGSSARVAPSGEETGPRPLAPGAACGVPLVTGDAVLGVTGTVTHVQGDHVLMMGHPFMQRGPVNLPLATAEILTILPSREMSFKLGQIGEVVGRVHHDQRAGLAGLIGPGPEMIPVEVTIVDPGFSPPAEQTYRFGVVDDPLLTPALVFWTLYNSLLARGDDASDQTIRYTLESRWSGDGELEAEPLVLSGLATGPGGAMGLAAEWLTPFTLLLDNPFRPLTLDGVKARLEVARPGTRARITGLDAERHRPRGAGSLSLQVELTPHQGEARIETVHLDLPASLVPGTYRLVAASEAEFFGLEAQRAASRFQVRSLAAALEILREPRSTDRLVVALMGPGSNLLIGDREHDGLPASLGRVMARGNPEVQRTMADYHSRATRALPFRLDGHAVRQFQILPSREPLAEEKRP